MPTLRDISAQVAISLDNPSRMKMAEEEGGAAQPLFASHGPRRGAAILAELIASELTSVRSAAASAVGIRRTILSPTSDVRYAQEAAPPPGRSSDVDYAQRADVRRRALRDLCAR